MLTPGNIIWQLIYPDSSRLIATFEQCEPWHKTFYCYGKHNVVECKANGDNLKVAWAEDQL